VTVNIVVVTHEAIVFGCDSVASSVKRFVDPTTLNLKPNGNGGFSTDIKFSDVQEVVVDVTPGVMKMFELHNKNDTHVAAITTGVAELDGRSMGDLSHEFFEKQKAMAKPRANVKVVASDFYKFIRGKYLEIYPEGPNQFKPWLEFLIGGYGKKDRFPRLYRVYVHEDKILKVHSDGSGGTAWGGQSTAVEGFLNGVANQMKNSIEFQYAESIKSLQQGFVNSLVDYETKTGTKIAINDLKLPNAAQLDWRSTNGINTSGFSDQTAVNLTSHLVNTQSGLARFEYGVATVGGRTRIGIITRKHGFKSLNEPELTHAHTGLLDE